MPCDSANVAWDVRHFDRVDSTNVVAMDLAREGSPEGLVVVAEYQTAGRGRLGRTWQAPPGSSLLASILFRPASRVPPPRSHLLTAAVALAAADCCAQVAGFRPGIKWPNDLVVEVRGGWRKLGGVLAESDLLGGQLRSVVVGLGLNLNWPTALPSDLAGIAVAANHLAGRTIDRDELLDALLSGVADRYGVLAHPERWRDIAEEFRVGCATIGRTVRVEMGTEILQGKATEISDEGLLGVEVGARTHWVAAADVTHVRAVI